MSCVPAIFVLATHVSTDELHQYEDEVFAAGGALTYDPKEARIFVGKISQKKRAGFELRSLGVWTEDAPLVVPHAHQTRSHSTSQPEAKRRKVIINPAASLSDSSSSEEFPADCQPVSWPDLAEHILLLKVEWLDLCLKHKIVVPYTPHLVYYGKLLPASEASSSSTVPGLITYIKATPESSGATTSARHITSTTTSPHARRSHSSQPLLTRQTPPKLHRATTSEHDASGSATPSQLPELPSWAKAKTGIYACCRSTPLHPVNAAFISMLTRIKLTRTLRLDEIGVRAYSTSIASLSAYPHLIQSEQEVTRLPGCSDRIAELWREWYDSASTDSERFIKSLKDIENDPDMKILKSFYDIWGVGADTARKLLFTHGFKDLDDIVQYYWQSLSRVQQIGVKFYDEFLLPIPRQEVEEIALVIHQHARTVCGVPETDFGTENDVVCVIVGGYRRGKTESGDVDVVLSHRDETLTNEMVVRIVHSLEGDGWITHTLTLQTTTSDRDQQTLPYRSRGGHGFDSLDKALCVWQNPNFDDAGDETAKNPNVHRRVDIILSPWRTVGCAILGWSGGTTFQRDLRRFAQKEKGWKFDSSGARNRGSGMVVDLESPRDSTDGDTWEDRERRVMDGIGFGYRPPSERCTG
jgi:DNA polymerase IV